MISFSISSKAFCYSLFFSSLSTKWAIVGGGREKKLLRGEREMGTFLDVLNELKKLLFIFLLLSLCL